MIRLRLHPFLAQRPRRSGRNLFGALAGLALLAFASLFALAVALVIGVAWGVARLIRPAQREVAGRPSSAPSADVLEGEFRVLRSGEPVSRELPIR